ncbi:MAG: hypothetical protein H6538_01035 [Bacteroidales bacterium]|nr:hypothetical protein [Bacteroidales bacterium]MCB9012627.1 hypothetical protein [Bacteroidales bacterium]
MKKILLLIISVALLTSCGGTRKQLQRGNYDAVINKTVKKLVKKPDSAEDAKMLDKAYNLGNSRDLERIKYLKLENNPNNYDEVFARYESLKARQNKVRTVMPINLNGGSYSYPVVDYDAEIVSAKRKAAEYFYANGKKLLENPDKQSHREAYYQLVRAQQYSGDSYPDLNELITQARYMGMSRVLVQIENSARILISPDFQDELLSINAQDLNSEWVEFHLRNLNENMDYDYMVVIHIIDILVSPEETKDVDKIYKKEVPDGFDYAKDARGNVMKDTAGNDIKITRYKTLQCTLIETSQKKSVNIRGEVEIVELEPLKKLLVKEPIGAENVFTHSSARAIGDQGALDNEALEKIKNQVVPYPTDIEMIFNTAQTLKPAIRNSITNNRRYIN